MQEIGNTLQKTGTEPASDAAYQQGRPQSVPQSVSVAELHGSLHRRIWSFNRNPDAAERVLILLTDGGGELEWPDGLSALQAPAVQWLGIPAAARLRLDPGTTGYVATLNETLIADIVGNRAESQTLAGIIDRSFLLSLAGEARLVAELSHCLDALGREMAQSQNGSPLMIVSWMRILFVAILRRVSTVHTLHGSTRGEAPIILQRFRQLVELHFREQWSVGQYAAALRVSNDRLHSICTRDLGKPPKALIGERVIREAGAHLARSMLTIKQISFALGFRDQAHFSNFFKLKTGRTPGAMRAMFEKSRQQEVDSGELIGFADWP